MTTEIAKTSQESKKFTRELAALNYGLAVREREIAARTQNSPTADSKTKNRQVTTFTKFENALSFVDDEISKSLKKVSWKRLTPSYKLKFMREYLERCDFLDDQQRNECIKYLKTTKGDVDVDYDMLQTRVTKLNFDWQGISL